MGLVCSQTGPHQVVPLQVRAPTHRTMPSVGTIVSMKSQRPGVHNFGQMTKRIPVNPCPAETVNIHVDACLLNLSKITKDMGLYSELYKHPIVAVNITVISTDKFKTNILYNPTINWGTLTVLNQVPKELPSVICPGTTLIHAVLERSSPVTSGITLSGIVDGKKMDYSAAVEENVQYMVDPIVMADILQLLQEQLPEEEKICKTNKEQVGDRSHSITTGNNTNNNVKTSKHTPSTSRPSTTVIETVVSEEEELHDTKVIYPTTEQLPEEEKICKTNKEQAGNCHHNINTGNDTNTNVKTGSNTPSTSRPSTTVIKTVVSEEEELHDTKVVYPTTRRKDTPATMRHAVKPGKRTSLRNLIEASTFQEADEETESDTSLQRRMSRCMSMSHFGRMSRMSRRRYSRSSSVDFGTSDSSLMVNPPGSERCLQTRMSRRKRDRRLSNYSNSNFEYRHRTRSMALSDVDTSAVESERLPSFSSMGGSWSESSCGKQERRFSCDLRNKTERVDAYPTDTSSKGASSDEKINSQRSSSNDLNIMHTSFSESEVFSSTIPGRVKKKSGLQTGETSSGRCSRCASGSRKKSTDRRLRRMNSIIVEEKDPGEETETDGCVSEVECGRRWSSISRSTSRRKRFSKRRITYSDVARLSKIGNMAASNDQDQLPLTKVDESSFEDCDK